MVIRGLHPVVDYVRLGRLDYDNISTVTTVGAFLFVQTIRVINTSPGRQLRIQTIYMTENSISDIVWQLRQF